MPIKYLVLNRFLVAGAMLSLSAAAAFAQQYPARNYDEAARSGEFTSGGADFGPGGLTAADVVGKRLLDSEGNFRGTIERISPDGQTALVRFGSQRTTADMRYLSLGMGAHTVIEQKYSQADLLNAQTAADLAARQARSRAVERTVTTTYSGSSQPVLAPAPAPVPLVTTTTTTTTEREIRR